MKDLRNIIDTYLSVRAKSGRTIYKEAPKATYLGDNEDVPDLLKENCTVVDPEDGPPYEVGTHSTGFEIVVLDGGPEPFKHLVKGAKLVVYIGPKTHPRDSFRGQMEHGAKGALNLHRTPGSALVYSCDAVINALVLGDIPTTRPPKEVWTTTTTAGPVSPEEEAAPNGWRPTDDPEKPVNTTPPPRDFFSMGQ